MFITTDNSFKTKLSLIQKIHARDNNVHEQHNKLLYYSVDIMICKAIFMISLAGYIM
jgi:hypothetical protein